jgi:hypothetical protein
MLESESLCLCARCVISLSVKTVLSCVLGFWLGDGVFVFVVCLLIDGGCAEVFVDDERMCDCIGFCVEGAWV